MAADRAECERRLTDLWITAPACPGFYMCGAPRKADTPTWMDSIGGCRLTATYFRIVIVCMTLLACPARSRTVSLTVKDPLRL